MAKLYGDYSSQGLEILAFPCNQFGGQEPGTAAEIKSFAQDKYKAKYPIMAKINVNDPDAHPLYTWMKDETSTFGIGALSAVKWNFGKFLIDKQGKCVGRFAPTSSPLSLIPDIQKYL